MNFNILERILPSSRYRGEIFDSGGNLVWKMDNLNPSGTYGVFTVLCHREYFEPGDYTLRVIEIDPASGAVGNQSDFEFIVTGE